MNKSSCLIAPSILSANFLRLGEQITACEKAGADWIHVDVMDGHFVPNLTMGPFIVAQVRQATSLPIDVHLMIDNPDDLLEAFVKAGATNLTVHVETCRDVVSTIKKIHSLDCRAGVTLNPATPVDSITPSIPHADLILVMTVHPGFSGQNFMSDMLEKIASVRKLLDEENSPAYLEVDGGINATNLAHVRDEGANVFVAANAIFRHPGGIAAGIQLMRQELGESCQ